MTDPINNLMQRLAAVLIVAFFVPAAVAQSDPDDALEDASVNVPDPDVIIHVQGLACSMCARSVTNEVKKVGAVRDVQVLLENDQRVLVTLNEGARVEENALREAVERAGFSTRKVKFVDDASSSSSSSSQ